MLELLTHGLPDIDIDDLDRNTLCCAVSPERERWFWEAVRSFGKEQRARLLLFVLGSSHAPAGGFAKLLSEDGRLQSFVLMDGYDLESDSLPRAHSCYNTIDLPHCPSYKVLHDKLLFAIEETYGFSGVER